MDFFEIKGHENYFRLTLNETYGNSPFGGKDLKVKIRVKSYGLSADISVYTTTQELEKFHDELTKSHIALKGEVQYTNYERDMELNLQYDYQGHVRVSGTLHVWPDRNNLSFDFETDQSYINNTLNQLKTVSTRYD